MRDKLEDFVSEHRDEFDVFEPRPDLWQNICQEIPAPEKEAKVINIKFGERASFSADFLFMRIAAAVVLLLGCGLTLFLMKQNAPDANTMMAASQQQVISNIAPEIVEVEAYYVSEIEEMKGELSEYDKKILGLSGQKEIDRELARLDSSYMQLKKQLYTTPNTEEIVEAMVQNLQIRIEVLNRQLEVLQNIKKMEKTINAELKENETTNI
ncbi:hypothetical protein [Pontibacter cellulosilyticus]|uniref:Anti-sigma factor n=1 Tax=Pontibacter cellulosilyticus TaxID=1720253 RepID=A0A923N7R8_9BACT|nr:hypothetical protein [Pontibacter cellulosilyticus]MBC5992971.1 hypothetical protein [Pontibacter cellulosilyticus]